MPVYLVERTLLGATVETVEDIGQVLNEVCRTFTAQGSPVRFLRSTFIPGESRLRCLFEAPSSDLVRDVNDAAGFPYERIVLAIDLGASASAIESESP